MLFSTSDTCQVCQRRQTLCVLGGKAEAKTDENIQNVGSRGHLSVLSSLLTTMDIGRRVSEMEEKLDGIFALLASGNRGTAGKKLDTTTYRPPDLVIDSGIYEGLNSPRRSALFSSAALPWTPSIIAGFELDEPMDVIGKGIISFEKADQFVRALNNTACNFPFIVIKPQTSLDFLRREKPFLLLCILTISADSNVQLQDKLEKEVRETLALKVIVNSEKSLDLLQGLLLYLSWYALLQIWSQLILLC
jgi:hypothetical protein